MCEGAYSEVYVGARLLRGDSTAWTGDIDEPDNESNFKDGWNDRADGESNVDTGKKNAEGEEG